MKRLGILMVLAIGALFQSCACYDIEQTLLVHEELTLTWKGDVQAMYAPSTWQYSFNAAKNEYRVNDDNMANYFVVRCSERPSAEGQELGVNVEWTVATNIKRYEGLRFKVERVASDGRIWLWNKSQKIGIVIKDIQ